MATSNEERTCSVCQGPLVTGDHMCKGCRLNQRHAIVAKEEDAERKTVAECRNWAETATDIDGDMLDAITHHLDRMNALEETNIELSAEMMRLERLEAENTRLRRYARIASGYLHTADSWLQNCEREGDPAVDAACGPPVSVQQILDMASSAPDVAIKYIPRDGASQTDHYIYGAPKSETEGMLHEVENLSDHDYLMALALRVRPTDATRLMEIAQRIANQKDLSAFHDAMAELPAGVGFHIVEQQDGTKELRHDDVAVDLLAVATALQLYADAHLPGSETDRGERKTGMGAPKKWVEVGWDGNLLQVTGVRPQTIGKSDIATTRHMVECAVGVQRGLLVPVDPAEEV